MSASAPGTPSAKRAGNTSTSTAAPQASPAAAGSGAKVANLPSNPAPTGVATPAPAASPGGIDASFGLVRAEPDGSLVIAGSAAPGETVDVYADDKLLGETKAEDSGDWVLVPDKPIASGGVELTLGVKGQDGRAPQSYVVAIDPTHKSEPLVVASTPGHMSTVLQGLAKPETLAASPGTQVASAAPSAPAAFAAERKAAPAAPVAASAPAVAAASPTSKAAAPAVAASGSSKSASALPATASAEPVAPSIDAIEIDGDTDFFAGAGPDGDTVRLYINDKFIADAVVAGGRWLIQASKVLTQHEQTVRIDVLKPDASAVTARAEVNFVVDVPSGGQPATPATAVASAAGQSPVAGARSSKATGAGGSASLTTPGGSTAMASAGATSGALAAGNGGESGTNGEVATGADGGGAAATATSAAGSGAATGSGQPAAVAAAPTGGSAAAKATVAPVGGTAILSAAAPEVASSVPTLVAEPVGGADSGRFASGKAIIRHGDNLWTIARRVYGAGIRYTTIYQANADQIRDPNWIYPGQVFDLPQAETGTKPGG